MAGRFPSDHAGKAITLRPAPDAREQTGARIGRTEFQNTGPRRSLGLFTQLKCINSMIPNHKQFIEAINQKRKVCLRFYSMADTGVVDLVCAPMAYGPGAGIQDGVNRYWF